MCIGGHFLKSQRAMSIINGIAAVNLIKIIFFNLKFKTCLTGYDSRICSIPLHEVIFVNTIPLIWKTTNDFICERSRKSYSVGRV